MIERNQLTLAGKIVPIGRLYKDDLLRRSNNAVI